MSLLSRLSARVSSRLSQLHHGYKARLHKRADDGGEVVLAQNANGGWYAGRPGDASLDPHPMGEFPSEQAARRWADQRFPGGAWERAGRGAAYP